MNFWNISDVLVNGVISVPVNVLDIFVIVLVIYTCKCSLNWLPTSIIVDAPVLFTCQVIFVTVSVC